MRRETEGFGLSVFRLSHYPDGERENDLSIPGQSLNCNRADKHRKCALWEQDQGWRCVYAMYRLPTYQHNRKDGGGLSGSLAASAGLRYS
jgi:hypothetical protein